MIEQLRELLRRRPFEPFGIELSTGRVLNVYEPGEVATSFADPGAPRHPT